MKRAKEVLDDSPKRVRKEWKGIDLNGVRSAQLAEYYQKDDPIAVQLVANAIRGPHNVTSYITGTAINVDGGRSPVV